MTQTSPRRAGRDATSTETLTFSRRLPRPLRQPVVWGVVFGGFQVIAPLLLWWLDAATVQTLLLCMIAGVYVGFAVADGRPKVIAVEATVTSAFVLAAAISVTGSVWILVAGYLGHGAKDFWQERTGFVANTRWWPPFCAAVDWVVAVALAIEIWSGVSLRS